MESLVTLGRYVSNLIRFGKPYAPEQLHGLEMCLSQNSFKGHSLS